MAAPEKSEPSGEKAKTNKLHTKKVKSLRLFLTIPYPIKEASEKTPKEKRKSILY